MNFIVCGGGGSAATAKRGAPAGMTRGNSSGVVPTIRSFQPDGEIV